MIICAGRMEKRGGQICFRKDGEKRRTVLFLKDGEIRTKEQLILKTPQCTGKKQNVDLDIKRGTGERN